jgi:hypothetical protein
MRGSNSATTATNGAAADLDPLTPALSRRERVVRRDRWGTAHRVLRRALGRPFSLREKDRMRGSNSATTATNGAAADLDPLTPALSRRERG